MGGEVRGRVRAHPWRWGWLASVALWSTSLVVDLVVRGGRDAPIMYDEWLYWNLSKTFESRFALTGYTETLRGVVFPATVSWISSGFGLFELGPRETAVVLTLVCIPLLTAVIVPSIARSLGLPRPGFGRIVALNVLFFLFWRNDSFRLLSDIPSLTAFAGAVAILLRPAAGGAETATNWVRRLALGGAAGLLLAVAANTRPAYLVLGAVAVLLLPLVLWGTPWARVAVVAGAVVVGLFVGLVPQVVVNHNQGFGWSFVPARSASLAEFQLQSGLRIQRYDTYVGPESAYPEKKMIYDNTANLGDLDPDSVTSLPAYVGAAIDHPLVIAESLARHSFHGLDIRWPGTYVEDIHTPTVPTQVLNFSVLLVAAWILARRIGRWWQRRDEREPGSTWVTRGAPARLWFAILLTLATAQVLVSAIETRFLLPLHLFLLAVVALAGDRDDLPRRPVARVGAVAALGAAVVALLAVSATLGRSLVPPIPI